MRCSLCSIIGRPPTLNVKGYTYCVAHVVCSIRWILCPTCCHSSLYTIVLKCSNEGRSGQVVMCISRHFHAIYFYIKLGTELVQERARNAQENDILGELETLTFRTLDHGDTAVLPKSPRNSQTKRAAFQAGKKCHERNTGNDFYKGCGPGNMLSALYDFRAKEAPELLDRSVDQSKTRV